MARKMMVPGKGRSSGPKPNPQPNPAPAPRARMAGTTMPKRQPAPVSQRQQGTVLQRGGGGAQTDLYSGGGGPGDFGGGGPMAMASVAPAVTAPSEEDYLAGDGSYQSQYAALKGALERYIADSDLQRTNYNTDYQSSLRDLGYTEGQNGAPGAWNWNDQLTASGKAYQNQLNDFAGRNMLQSQGYADAATDLERMFNQQYQQTATNKTNFMTGLDRELANYKGENTASQQAARAEAIARRAAQYGL